MGSNPTNAQKQIRERGGPKRTISCQKRLGCYKWYQSLSPSLLNYGGANLNEDVESLRGGVCDILGKSHIDKARGRSM
ncbi:hypothetical protein LINPERHAP1_LOCUS15724, partial [Linum perenne]